jgi:hypothetical protein
LARSYNVRTVAFAIGASAKWLDNLLSRYALPGVIQSRQGVERLIDNDGILAIEIVRMLVADLGMPLSQSVFVARTALEDRRGDDARFVAPGGVAIHIPLDRIRERLRIQILAAMEAVPNVSRGRPRGDRR